LRALTAQNGSTHYCVFDTALGPVGLVWSGRGVMRLQLPEGDRRATERRLCASASGVAEAEPDTDIAGVVASLQRYMAGERIDFSRVKLDLTGIGAFHRSIYASTRAVGWGETTTYGALAKQAGSPEAARAVGQAMGRNPVPIIVPCHRVLASGGKIGGFSAFGGAVAKARLLAMEGVQPGGGTPRLPGF
jgi:methylated-DNA-[protein]-cysteine S-methyltransferase